MADDFERKVLEQRRRAFAFKPRDWNENASAKLQNDASDRAFARTLAWIDFQPSQRVIDFGGASGGSIQPFLDRGCAPEQLAVVDVQADEIEIGRQKRPGIDFQFCDASKRVPFADAAFDVAMASTAFYEISDDVVRGMAWEMKRVTRPGGHIIVRDWTMPRPGARPVTAAFIESVFGLPVAHVERGAMNQIVGRAFSLFLPWLYYKAEPWSPWGMKVYVLNA